MKLTPVVLAFVVGACSNTGAQKTAPAATAAQAGSVTKATFGTTPQGEQVDVYTLTNANGIEVRVITFGGIITSIRVPDRRGAAADVALGFDRLEPYLT